MNTGAPDRWSAAAMRRRFISPELISGIVLVSVVIAVANEGDGVFGVFAITVISVLVFWATEVFAHVIAAQRNRGDGQSVRVSRSIRHALRESQGFLFAAVLPVAFLLIGTWGVRDGEVAYWTALWIQVGLLAVIGWIAFDARHIRWYWRLFSALATAGLGMLAILLKIMVH